jgi:hypothetical protein
MRMTLPSSAIKLAKSADVRALGQNENALLLLELLTGPWARLS